ncbi:MAG: N-acetyltransferase family protein [Persicimonas sp.]
MNCIQLKPSDAERYTRLRMEMLTSAPWAFGATPDDDRGLDIPHLEEMLAQEHYAIFASEDADKGAQNGELVAAAGIIRSTRQKLAHRAVIWGVYTRADQRGRGHGRAVMTAAIDLARSWPGVDYVDIAVTDNAPAAQHLYESLGFEAWGREPETLECDGRRYDEIHMTLRL